MTAQADSPISSKDMTKDERVRERVLEQQKRQA